ATLLLARLSAAVPTISFPINSQVPPVARIGEPFSFVFSAATFSSTSPVTFSLSNPPRWLSIDSGARRLFGTPREGDVAQGRVAGVPVNLVATDESGSTTLTATLVISRSPGPRVEIPLEEQAPGFGLFSKPSSILAPPGAPFSFDLDPNTFSKSAGAPINYYATMADNTPLPAWISFDPSSLSFHGQTPPPESLIQPPQRFSLQVVASNVVGFVGASLGLDIVVGNHRFVADETTIVLHAAPGAPVSYTGLRGNVKVEGKPATLQNAHIASTTNIPPWLSVDNGTWHITGVAPIAAESTNFTITMQDIFSDTLDLTVVVRVAADRTGLFTGDLPKLTVTAGRPFSFSLGPYLSSPQDTEISVETGSATPWIQFNSRTFTLSGNTPADLKDSAADVQMKARRRDSKTSVSLSLNIVIRAASGGKGTETPDSKTPEHPSKSSDGSFNPVLLAVLLPLLLLLVMATCTLFWGFRRRRNARQRPALTSRDISGPLPGTFVTKQSGTGVSHSLPDLSKYFATGFSADDVFGSDQKTYAESRTAFMAKPGLPPHPGSVKLLPQSSSSICPNVGVPQGSDKTAVAGGGGLGLVRPATQNKIRSSLSCITETSMNDEAGQLVDERALELVGNGNRMAFRDKIEINIPRFQQTPGSTYTDTTSARHCDTEMMPTPQASLPSPVLDTEVVPLRSGSTPSHYPLASTAGKPSWPWLRGAIAKQQVFRLGRGGRKLSVPPSVSTANSSGSEMTGASVEDAQRENGYLRTARDLASPPLTKMFSQALLSRPTTRSRPATSGIIERHSHDHIQTSFTNITNPSLRPCTGRAYPDTHGGSVGISYQDLAEQSPFRPSRTWSTVQTTDDWVDQTVGSLDALQEPVGPSRPTSQHNWAVLQESAILSSRDGADSGMSPELPSSVQLAPIQDGGSGTAPSLGSSRPGTANVGSLGLARQSHSKGFSSGSEGSKSDYAAFI
ncbi:hypothetical protein BT67DRAFT_345808, partial [Trichocladium antarcticum]